MLCKICIIQILGGKHVFKSCVMQLLPGKHYLDRADLYLPRNICIVNWMCGMSDV